MTRMTATRISKRLRRLSSLFGRTKRVVLIGRDVRDARGVLDAWLNTCEGGGALRTVTPPTGDSARGDRVAHEIVVLSTERPGRSCRWGVDVPDLATIDRDETWPTQANAAVICWPHAALTEPAERVAEAVFRLSGAVGEGRARGKLRRVAFVITGIPADIGPRHPSQARLDLPPKRRLDDAIRVQAREGAGVPGHPLADDRWSTYLRSSVAGNASVRKLHENVRLACGGACPIFFLATEPSGTAVTRILRWLNGDPEPRRQRVRPLLAAGVAASLLAALVTLIVVVPPGTQARVAPSTTSVEKMAGLADALDERLSAHERWSVRTAAMLSRSALETEPLRAARDAIRDARARIADVDAFVSWRSRLSRTRAALVDSVSSRGVIAPSTSDAARVAAESALDSLRNWSDRPWITRWRHADLTEARQQAGEIAVWWALTSLDVDLRPSGRLVADLGRQAAISSELTRLSFTEEAQWIHLRLDTPLHFLADYAIRLRDDINPYAGVFRRFVPFLSEPDVRSEVAALRELSVAEVLAARDLLRERVDELVTLVEMWERVSNTSRADLKSDLSTLATGLDEIDDAVYMEIALNVAGDTHWHVDYATSSSGPWRASTLDGDGGATIVAATARPDATLYLRFNWRSRTHAVESRRAGSACTGGSRIELPLWQGHGVIQTRTRNVHWNVRDGRPTWPPSKVDGGAE